MKAINAQSLSLPRIYRHFAVFTVAATLLVAVFADGENREAAAQAAQSRQAPTIGPQDTPIEDERSRSDDGSFGSTGSQFGAPMISSGGSRNDSLATAGPQRIAAPPNPTGLSDEEFAKLTPAEQAALIKKLYEQRYGESPGLRAQQIAKLVSASAHRSGSSPSDDD